MVQQLTPSYVDSLKSDLSRIAAGTIAASYETVDEARCGDKYDEYDQYLFQIIEFDINSDVPKLLYGTKKSLEKRLQLEQVFPSGGIEVDPKFMVNVMPQELRVSQRSTVRFLKQARKLSQLMAATWLEDENISTEEKKIQVKLVRTLLNNYNLIPDAYLVNNDGKIEKKLEVDDLNTEFKKIAKNLESEDSSIYLIKPEYSSYKSICLSLLLCGQVYYKDSINKSIRILEPIFSNYEMVYEYGLDLSWDTYYATRKDIAQAHLNPNPPFTEVTLGYPPKPSEFALKQENIKQWAEAEDEGSSFPFYPSRSSEGEFESNQVQFVNPPFPYVPLSTV